VKYRLHAYGFAGALAKKGNSMTNSYLVAGEMAIPRKAGPAQFQPHAFRLKSRSPSSGKFGRNSLNAGKAGPAWL
jgi:hypothetical protein